MTDVALRDLQGSGTSEVSWSHLALPPLELGGITAPRVVIVSPHPDDEVLAAGGTLTRLGAAGLDVAVVAVTDGEASHAGRAEELRQRRPQESAHALAALDLAGAVTQHLHHPDGHVDEAHLADALRGLLGAEDLVLGPWSGDGHPDHEAVGRVTAGVCAEVGCELWAYPVWTWHWATPASVEIPWAAAFRVDLTEAIVTMKANAISCFTSQLEGPAPILPAGVLAHFTRSYEVFWRP